MCPVYQMCFGFRYTQSNALQKLKTFSIKCHIQPIVKQTLFKHGYGSKEACKLYKKFLLTKSCFQNNKKNLALMCFILS